jgi:xanthine dehydrogenase accessory factor
LKYFKLWQVIQDEIKDITHDDVVGVLHFVVNHAGSSPGKQGFKMLVMGSDNILFSIGGGIMEHKIIEKSKEQIKNNSNEIIVQDLMHDEKSTGEKSGLVCSGMQTVVSIPFNRSIIDLINKIIHSYTDPRHLTMIITEKGIELTTEKSDFSSRYNYEGKIAENWIYQEKIGKSAFNLVYVFGGGHVGEALTRQLSLLDYHITICDDRENLVLINENQYAHEFKIQSYQLTVEEIVSNIELKELDPSNISIVIVTAGIKTDYKVLTHLQHLNKDNYPKFIGLMGSKSKISKLFARLRNENIMVNNREDFLKVIHAPIGLKINSESVEEIAVSIAAQLIKVINQT